jgi:hypothetical protein
MTPSACLDYDAFKELAMGRVGIVVLRGLLEPEVMVKAKSSVDQLVVASATTSYVNGALTTIGPYLAKSVGSPGEYFREAERVARLFDEADFDLPALVRKRLISCLGLTTMRPAVESTGEIYADCIVRIHADGVRNPLHNDFIVRDGKQAGLSVATITHQLSCVVCLQECDSGGELFHYQKFWEAEDEVYKIKGGLGYDEAVVGTCEPLKFKPRKGDIYLINPVYYHSIERVQGSDRLTMGFFIGLRGTRFDVAEVWS